MAETTLTRWETVNMDFKAENKFALTDKFDAYARSRGLDDKGIEAARKEILSRLEKYNGEKGVDIERFNRLVRTIGALVDNEIGKVRSSLAKESGALQGIQLNIPTPQAEPTKLTTDNRVPNRIDTSIAGMASGGLQNILNKRGQLLALAGQ